LAVNERSAREGGPPRFFHRKISRHRATVPKLVWWPGHTSISSLSVPSEWMPSSKPLNLTLLLTFRFFFRRITPPGDPVVFFFALLLSPFSFPEVGNASIPVGFASSSHLWVFFGYGFRVVISRAPFFHSFRVSTLRFCPVRFLRHFFPL